MRPSIRKPIILDESGSPVFGVAPVSILEKALRSWTPEELAEYEEFVLINDELSLRRIENEVGEAGGHPVEPKGIDSQTYWLPETGLLGVFDLREEYDKALAASLKPGFHPIRRFLAKVEYRNNLRIGLNHDACGMLASARLVLLRRETGLPLDRLKKRADAILNETNSLFYKRTILSTALPAIILLFLSDLLRHGNGGKSSGQPDKSNHTASEPVPGLEESAESAPRDLPPQHDSQGTPQTFVEPIIKDDTGDKLYGVDPAKVLRGTLRLWNHEEYRYLTEAIIVADDLTAKHTESKLLQRGARPLYPMRPGGRTYALKREGSVQIINIARIRNAILADRSRTLFYAFLAPFVWYCYRTRMWAGFLNALPYGLAYAQLAHIERDTKLSGRTANDKSTDLYWNLKFAIWRRFHFWAMMPPCILLFALSWLRNILRRSANKDPQKPRT